jgi:hypothetical protein
MTGADIVLRPFGPFVIIEPRSLRGRRFADRKLQEFRFSNGVLAFTDTEQGQRIGQLIRKARLKAGVR